VILREENYEAREIIEMALGDASALSVPFYELLCAHSPDSQRLSILRRVNAGVIEFVRLSHEKAEQDAKKRTAKSKGPRQ